MEDGVIAELDIYSMPDIRQRKPSILDPVDLAG
jgi:hypothetical protein